MNSNNGNGHYPDFHPKIVILGGGGIGRITYENIIREGQAREVVLCNRSDKGEEKIIASAARDMDEANRLKANYNWRAGRPEPETSSFRGVTGEEKVPGALHGAEIVLITAGAAREFIKDDKDRVILYNAKGDIAGYSTDPKGESQFFDTNGQSVQSVDGKPKLEERDSPNMLKKNAAIIIKYAEMAKKSAPDAVFGIITNPVDSMAKLFQEVSGIEPNRIFGLSGMLDGGRMSREVSEVLGVHAARGGVVVGPHNKFMMPDFSELEVQKHKGDAWEKVDPTPEQKQRIIEGTRNGGAWYGKNGPKTAEEAPGVALALMTKTLIDAQRGKPVPPIEASTWSDDHQLYIGQQIQFGRDGSYAVVPRQVEAEGWNAAVNNLEDTSRKLYKILGKDRPTSFVDRTQRADTAIGIGG